MRRVFIFIAVGAALAAGLAVAGWIALGHLGNGQPAVQVVVTVAAPGMAPETVEALVAQPLEDQLAQLPDLSRLRTTCMEGAVRIVARFGPKTTVDEAVHAARQRLKEVQARLPAEVERPLVSAVMVRRPVWSYTLRCDRCAPGDLDALQEQELRPVLLATPGVAAVETSGGSRRELSIAVAPEQLQRLGLTRPALASAISSGLIAPQAGLIHLREAVSPKQLYKIVVHRGPTGEVRLGDVARIQLTSRPPACETLHNDRPALRVVVFAHAAAAGKIDTGKLRVQIDASARRRAPKGLVLTQLDPRLALELRLLPGNAAVPRPRGQVVGVSETVVQRCGERDERGDSEGRDSRIWAWAASGEPPPSSARVRAALAPNSVPLDGSSRALVVELLGKDHAALLRQGRAVLRWLSARDELDAVEAEGLKRRKQVMFRLRRDRAAAFGVTEAVLATSLRTARDGVVVGRLQRGRHELPVRLILGGERRDVDALAKLQIQTANGAMVPLAHVANVHLASAPAALLRCDRRRCLVINAWGPTAGFKGWSSRLRADLEAKFSGVVLRFSSPDEP
jgi:multidrug efflux pump subunit AcrB